MKIPDLTKLANFPEYKHEPRIVKPEGLVKDPQLVLKMYTMMRNQVDNRGVVRNAKKFMERVIKRSLKREGAIESGLGFVILSEDMLNMAIWNNKYPIVLKNGIWTYKEDFKDENIKHEDIRDVGSFCVWELGIVAHERDAWKRYLASERAEVNKRNYLGDTISGGL